jgi:hypothetical protein
MIPKFDLALTLRVYVHSLREEESDLSFLDFGGVERHPRCTRFGRVGVWAHPPASMEVGLLRVVQPKNQLILLSSSLRLGRYQ